MKAFRAFRFRRALGISLVTCGLIASSSCYEDFSDDMADRPLKPEGQLTVVGAKELRLGESVQLSAWLSDGTQPEVRWKVNGLSGGTKDVGTISPGGLYRAPEGLPYPHGVTITATTVSSPHATSGLVESVLNPVPQISMLLASPIAPEPNYVLDVQGENFVKGAEIQVGGTPVTTTFVSRNDLQATTTFARGVTTVSVRVVNPSPGASASPSALAQIRAVRSMRSVKQLWEPVIHIP